ncbi:MAG TPA: N-acetyl-gamma-glutamyl-phosphate reductase [Actinomycetota bacterium]|nr:N-acetyl-gamma-glutamyl-phosphate reductase [Actinomycetota bacterium]
MGSPATEAPGPVGPVRAAVFGASGYLGAELLRLLSGHPDVSLTAVGAGEQAGRSVGDVHPHLASVDLQLERLDESVATRADVAFLSLPHGRSGKLAPRLLDAGMRVIDLAGDFRLAPEAYPDWYGFDHPTPEWSAKAVYGLPELFGEQVSGASLVANPGCYPTAAALALVPLLRAGLVTGDGIIIDAKSGISGAGAKPTAAIQFARRDGSVEPYRVGGHQHTPEIEQVLESAAGHTARVTFVPHLVPSVRGVLATCYAPLADSGTTDDLTGALSDAYKDTPFVRALPPGTLPDPKRVTAANVCEVAAVADTRTGTAVIVGAVDNLVKGGSGQAVQNMNLMFGFDETTGLPTVGTFP